jgi:hypothetical protein
LHRHGERSEAIQNRHRDRRARRVDRGKVARSGADASRAAYNFLKFAFSAKDRHYQNTHGEFPETEISQGMV